MDTLFTAANDEGANGAPKKEVSFLPTSGHVIFFGSIVNVATAFAANSK